MSRGTTLTVSQPLVTEECCTCHTTFAMTKELHDDRLKDKRAFYCPLGHQQSYMGESDEAKIRRLTRERDAADDATKRVMRQRDKAQKDLRAMKRTAEATQCPAGCHRTFSPTGMKRHLTTKHPGYKQG